MTAWWRHFPRIESCPCEPPPPGAKADARYAPGTPVRLVDRPGKIRRILRSEWHWHRQRFVFIVETSAPPPFAPYWFAEQIETILGQWMPEP